MNFPSTHWSLLALATEDGSTQSRRAVENLCGRYWGAIHTFIRSRRVPDPEAQDLTQDFMLHLLQSSFFVRGDRARGRFRSFLLGALARFLADAADRRTALKRGGTMPHFSLDDAGFAEEVAVSCPPESVRSFDREWAMTILESALENVRREYTGPTRAEMFGVLKRYLPGGASAPSYAEAARRFGISPAALKSEVHRLRARFRDAVRNEVAQTVAAPHEIEAELMHLQQVLTDRNCEWAQEAEWEKFSEKTKEPRHAGRDLPGAPGLRADTASKN